MKLILIDGGPASGKNTLGDLLVKKFNNSGDKAILLDLDTYVEQFNPKWVWDNKQHEEEDQLNARINITKDIDKYLKEDFIVFIIGERFLTEDDVTSFIDKLKIICPIYLYHLSIPFVLREKRLYERGAHSLIDLGKDQEDRDAVKDWLGYVYENISSPEVDASNLMALIQRGEGLLAIK